MANFTKRNWQNNWTEVQRGVRTGFLGQLTFCFRDLIICGAQARARVNWQEWEGIRPTICRESARIVRASEESYDAPIYRYSSERAGRRISRVLPDIAGLPHAKRDD